jgi:hypothetical protein
MNKKIFALSILGAIVFLWIAIAFSQEKGENPVIETKELSVWELASISAMRFGQDPVLINKIIMCESGGRVLPHDGNRGVNATGIHDKSFNYWLPEYVKETGEQLDITTMYGQVTMLAWRFSKGEKAREAWTSYRAIKNGGTYAFYSTLLKKHFVVKCS